MREPLIFAFDQDAGFARAVAACADAELGELVAREFPDGETYLRLMTDCSSRDVVIVGSLHRPNPRVLPLLLLIDAARQHGAARVGLLAPYLAYMRQDREFQPGEAVTARAFARVLSNGIDWIVTVEPHLHRIQRLSDAYPIPAVALRSTGEIGAWIAGHVSKPIVIGPDRESRQWASRIAREAAAPWLVLDKTRQGDTSVTVSVPNLGGHSDCTPVLVDDIISTGRTMMAAVSRLGAAGTPAPVCVGVHAVFADGAYEALMNSGASRIVTTNTIMHPSNGIDVVPLVARALRERTRFD